jgi:pSer/pThr/pTyr-binding forkhead associated (FHA) protein
MSARLLALDGGPDILIGQKMVIVGRHPSCDARRDSLRMSRRHCCLTREGGAIVVRDLGSMNGIRINGERVQVGQLRRGDELSIAHYRFRFEDDSDWDSNDEGPDRRPPVNSRPWIADLLSEHSRLRFISRN